MEGIVLVDVENVVVSCPVDVVLIVGECYCVPLCWDVALYCCWTILDCKKVKNKEGY